MAKMKFPPEFSTKVDLHKISLDVFRPWIAKKVTGYLGMEDDIVVRNASDASRLQNWNSAPSFPLTGSEGCVKDVKMIVFV